jgi:flagellar biosynthesis/type III secretory pathway M-ring protein FliF/YscJ
MDFLKSQFARLQAQFEQLTASQKMLSVSLIAIMVMTLLWWGRYAGQAEMEPIADHDFTPEEVARITGEMRAHNIPFTSVGSRVLVAADRKLEATGTLIYSDILPQDQSTTLLLDIMAKTTSALSSDKLTDIAYNAAHEASLAKLFRGFKGVQTADVNIAPAKRQGFEQETPVAASVNIILKAGQKFEPHLPVSIAAMMSGAVSGLKRSNVHIVVNGMPREFPKDDELQGDMSDERLRIIAELELHYKEKIREHFKFCEGVSAVVSVALNDKTIDTHDVKYDAKASFSKDVETTSDNNTTGGKSGATGEPGVVPNTGANAPMTVGAPSAGDGPSSQTDKNSTKSQVFPSSIENHIHQSAGGHTVMSASVMFPRSMFVKSYLAEKQVDKTPSPVILEAYIRDICDRYKPQVKGCCEMVADTNITVDAYPDFVPPAADIPTQSVGGVSMMLSGHIKEIALAALAVASLFMVSMMVRKSGGPVLAGVGAGGAAMFGSEGGTGSTVDALLAKASGGKSPADVTAEVGEGGQMLDGIELDEESVRNQQVVEQVSNLVKDNPDAAANLIKRWMNRT